MAAYESKMANKEEVAELQVQMAVLKEQMENKEKDVTGLREQMAAHASRMEAKDEEAAALQVQLAALQSQMAELVPVRTANSFGTIICPIVSG
jgi:chromosome segregation ATPase